MFNKMILCFIMLIIVSSTLLEQKNTLQPIAITDNNSLQSIQSPLHSPHPQENPNVPINVTLPPAFDINKQNSFANFSVNIEQNRVSGVNNKIDGKTNSLIGNNNNIVGTLNVIQGNTNSLNGHLNNIWGLDNKVIGNTNNIIGNKNKNLGQQNQLVGDNNYIVGGNNTSVGNNNNLIGEKNYLWGINNIMKGENNMGVGVRNRIYGDLSIVKGEMNMNIGNNNVILGKNNYVIGRDNEIGTGKAVGPSVQDFQNPLLTDQVMKKFNFGSILKAYDFRSHTNPSLNTNIIKKQQLKKETNLLSVSNSLTQPISPTLISPIEAPVPLIIPSQQPQPQQLLISPNRI